MSDEAVLRRVRLSRYLFSNAQPLLKSQNNLSIVAGVHLLHDAVELFLVALADHTNAKVTPSTKFEAIVEEIERATGTTISFRKKLFRLNRIRNQSKHDGIEPPLSDVNDITAAIPEFFEETSANILGLPFATLSLVDLLAAGESREYLYSAEKAFKEERYEDCLTDCRKAIYVEIEHRYDAAPFLEEGRGLYAALISRKVPLYARSADYIRQNVQEPTDYVVLDHDELQRDLLAWGVDVTEFLNVLRLTPEVYRYKDRSEHSGEWIIKRKFAIIDSPEIEETAEYVLATTIDAFLSIHRKDRAVRGSGLSNRLITLVREGVPLYPKASKSSSTGVLTPEGRKQLGCDFSVIGLDGGVYWYVSDFTSGAVFGFVHNDDVVID